MKIGIVTLLVVAATTVTTGCTSMRSHFAPTAEQQEQWRVQELHKKEAEEKAQEGYWGLLKAFAQTGANSIK